MKIWNQSHKQAAKRAVSLARLKVQIKPASDFVCVRCKAKQAEHLHHESYDPEHFLDLTPLCRQCHADRHKEIRALQQEAHG